MKPKSTTEPMISKKILDLWSRNAERIVSDECSLLSTKEWCSVCLELIAEVRSTRQVVAQILLTAAIFAEDKNFKQLMKELKEE